MKTTVTNMVQGPFVLVVTWSIGTDPPDHDFPMVVGPEGGFATKEAALEVAKQYEDDDLFQCCVAPLRDPGSLKRFMSW